MMMLIKRASKVGNDDPEHNGSCLVENDLHIVVDCALAYDKPPRKALLQKYECLPKLTRSLIQYHVYSRLSHPSSCTFETHLDGNPCL